MPKIQILPDNIANQIAAGEVVERPVAIVKELLENSIDAGAKNISVCFTLGGKGKIIVDDDGIGMSREDACLSVMRHATSKLNNISDLQRLNTFGFRGEALPSIASVSRFLLRSRRAEDEVGVELLINAGQKAEISECGMPCGTRVEISSLFHNVPARRRFLKSDETESGHIVKTVKAFIFAEKLLNISVFDGARKICESISSESWSERARSIFGINDVVRDIHFEKNGVSIEGTICLPGCGESNFRNVMTFVNRRLISSQLVNSAVSEAFCGFLPPNRKPVAFLLINLDRNAVDVNVHPTKREIRFRNEKFIKELLIEALEFWLKSFSVNNLKVSHSITHNVDVCKFVPPMLLSDSQQKFSIKNESSLVKVNNTGHYDECCRKLFISDYTSEIVFGNKQDWRFIGLIRNDCALFEGISGLIIFNFKLALRRIVYEKILRNDKCDLQNLLLPIDVLLDDVSIEDRNNILVSLERVGVVAVLNEQTICVTQIPQWFDISSVDLFIRELAKNDGDVVNLYQKLAALASRYAMYNKCNGEIEIMAIIKELSLCDNQLTCPRGFSIFFEVPFTDFNNRFGI